MSAARPCTLISSEAINGSHDRPLMVIRELFYGRRVLFLSRLLSGFYLDPPPGPRFAWLGPDFQDTSGDSIPSATQRIL